MARLKAAVEINHSKYCQIASYPISVSWLARYTTGVDAPKAWIERRNIPDDILVPMRLFAWTKAAFRVPFRAAM